MLTYSAIFIFFILILIFIFYLFTKHKYLHFKRLGIDYFEPSFPFGNVRDIFFGSKNMIMTFKNYHLQIKSKYAGIFFFTSPMFMIRDRDLIDRILKIDFDHFTDRGMYRDEENDPMSSNIYSLPGKEWSNMRKKLCPLYEPDKMKMIFPAIYDIGMSLQGYVGLMADMNPNNKIDLRDLFARYMTDVIVSVAFGIEVDSIRNPSEYFRKMGEKIAELSISYKMIIFFFYFNTPWLYKLLKLRVYDTEIEEFMIETVKQTLHFREKNKISRDDFMQILIRIRNGELSKSEKLNKTDDELLNEKVKQLSITECASNVFIFFSAGFETSSSIMACCLMELARNPQILKDVRNEIDSVLNEYNFKFTYECIRSLKYLTRCIDETVRMYPAIGTLPRVCTRDYETPDKNFNLKKGSKVLISVYGVHYDPEIYPNPEIFDPSRFTEEKKAKRHRADFLGFGLGPRDCNAKELSYLTISMGLATIISKFDFTLIHPLSANTKLDATKMSIVPEGGIHMKFVRRIFRN